MQKYNYTGQLTYNFYGNRYGIKNKAGSWVDDGLHCGECFEVKIGSKWVQTRLEYGGKNDGWYLVGLPDVDLEQLPVRM